MHISNAWWFWKWINHLLKSPACLFWWLRWTEFHRSNLEKWSDIKLFEGKGSQIHIKQMGLNGSKWSRMQICSVAHCIMTFSIVSVELLDMYKMYLILLLRSNLINADVYYERCYTFVGTGHPLNGSFIIVVLSYWEGEDPHLEHKIKFIIILIMT